MKQLLFILAMLSTWACKKGETQVNTSPMEILTEENTQTMAMSDASPLKELTTEIKTNLDIPKKIIKNGEIEIEVGNLKSAKEKVDEQIHKLKGYTQEEFFNNEETTEMVRMKIRIPHENFDALVSSVSEGVGTVTSKNISTEDVTEEYTDVSIRLKNKMSYLEKYRDLLKRSASTKDLLEIQEKIRGLEEEIESAEGRLRFIDDKVNYSTLLLVLSREKARNTVTSKIGFGSRFVDSLANGWNIFISFLLGLVAFWPFFLVVPLVIVLLRKWRRRKTNRK